MHAPIHTHIHIFSRTAHFFAHHKLKISLTVLVVALLTIASVSLNSLDLSHVVPSTQTHSAGVVMPLTYIEGSRYAHESELRTHYINTHLEQLKAQTQADKVYVVSYRYDRSELGLSVRISKTFEVGKAGITAPIATYEGISRMNWLVMMRSSYLTNNSLAFFAPLPRSYGLELRNDDGRAIGFLGADYLQEKPALSGETLELLEQTAIFIEAGFLQPIESLQSPKWTRDSS